MTDRQQALEKVARAILDGGMTDEEAHDQNDRWGWSFDVRWASQEYISDNDWTSVEGHVLSQADLEAAIDLATEWERRPPV